MLTLADRQKIERIRARWEAVQVSDETMGFRKASVVTTDGGDGQEHAGKKFRRRLSLGLALLSNPLGQRKSSQSQTARLGSAPSLTQATSTKSRSTMNLPTASNLSPNTTEPTPAHSPSRTAKQATTDAKPDLDATPRALPRSRTTSFIPRPVRSDLSVSATISEKVVTFEKLAQPHAVPSKIPTPSPPLSERRVTPRQHLQRNPSLIGTPNSTCVPPRRAVAPATYVRPRLAVRSRTTPNLVNPTTSQRSPDNCMQKSHDSSSGNQSPQTSRTALLQENVPTGRSVVQIRPHAQPKAARRESLSAIKSVEKRKSLGPVTTPNQTKQVTTPLTARKRTSSNFNQQTPVTASKRVSVRDPLLPLGEETRTRDSIVVTQARLLRPRDPPTPTITAVEFVPTKPSVMTSNRPSVEVTWPGTSFDMANGLGSFWRSSRSSNAAANSEVRVPRSYTFHNLGTKRGKTPPVSSIPEEHGTISHSNLVECIGPPIHSTLGLQQSFTMPNLALVDLSEHFPRSERRTSSPCSSKNVCARRLLQSSTPDLRAILGTVFTDDSPPKTSGKKIPTNLSHAAVHRPWSILEHIGSHDADIELDSQIKVCMPPLYWAGRFQSRFDQWRTEAMYAELQGHEPEGLLGQCKLDEEKLAACHIFAQLRDLCATSAAADSLWDFEYKYRKDNSMLSDPTYPVQQHRKQEVLQKGAFGRAVRRLTPRKKSFANLWKGWNKGEDSHDRPDSDVSSKGS